MLIVIVILGILSGMTLVAYGRGTDNAEATAALAQLDTAKSALLTYSMEHTTRNVDPLRGFVNANSNTIKTSLDKYLDSSAPKYFETIRVADSSGFLEVGFDGFTVSSGTRNALDKKITASGGSYRRGSSSNANAYSMWLRIK